MKLTAKQSNDFHNLITKWLKAQKLFDVNVDYEVSLNFKKRQPISLDVKNYPKNIDARLSVLVVDFLKDKRLSTRANTILRNANLKEGTLGNLVRKTAGEIMGYRNSGSKTVTELQQLLEQEELSLGMKVSTGPLEQAVLQKIKDDQQKQWDNQRE